MNKSIFLQMISIALPVSLQALICNSLTMIDQMMIGQLGEQSVASVALGGKLFFVLTFALGGLTAVASIYASQAEGARERSRHSSVMKITLLYSLVCVIPFFLVSFFASDFVLSLFTIDKDVRCMGASYLKIVCVGYFPTIAVMSASTMLRSTGHATIPLVAGIISVILNTALNAVFIFGYFGVSPMGIEGAAYATIISRTIEAMILLVFLEISGHPACLSRSLTTAIEKKLAWQFLVTSLPAIGNEMLWAVGNTLYSMIYGHLGTSELAAMTLTEPVQALSVGLFSGLSASAGIIVGNKLGAEEYDDAYESSWKFLKYCVFGCLVVAVILAVSSFFYVDIYKVTSEVKKITVNLLHIFCLYFVVKVCNMVCGSGIIRSGGETKYTLFLDVVGTYGIGIPLGIIAAFVLKMPIQWVYFIISIEEIVRLVFGVRRIKSRKWIRKIH